MQLVAGVELSNGLAGSHSVGGGGVVQGSWPIQKPNYSSFLILATANDGTFELI